MRGKASAFLLFALSLTSNIWTVVGSTEETYFIFVETGGTQSNLTFSGFVPASTAQEHRFEQDFPNFRHHPDKSYYKNVPTAAPNLPPLILVQKLINHVAGGGRRTVTVTSSHNPGLANTNYMWTVTVHH